MGDRIEQLIALGREHYNAGELERAEPFLAEASAARPSFPDIFNMLGVIYHAQGRFQDAEEAFETALRLNPRYTEAALNLSVTYNDRGKYDRAREVYSKAVSASAAEPRALDQFARGKLANMHADLSAGATPRSPNGKPCWRPIRPTSPPSSTSGWSATSTAPSPAAPYRTDHRRLRVLVDITVSGLTGQGRREFVNRP